MNDHEWEVRTPQKKKIQGRRAQPSGLVPMREPSAVGRLGGRMAEDAFLKEGAKEERRGGRAGAHEAQVIVERVSGVEKPSVKTGGR